MTLIEQKLVDAYAILVMANKYILKEEDRVNENQKLVPESLIAEIEIRIAERTIEKLSSTP